jgi:hypothetical protein
VRSGRIIGDAILRFRPIEVHDPVRTIGGALHLTTRPLQELTWFS